MPSAFGKPVTTANRFGVAAGGNGFKLITTLTASTSASLSYTAFDSTTHETYCVVLEDLAAASAGNSLFVNGSVDAGSTYGALWTGKTGADGTVVTTPTTSTDMRIAMNCSNSANVGVHGCLYLQFGTAASQRSVLYGTTVSRDNSNAMNLARFGAYYDSASPINALKFLFGAGNITSGTIHIYGLQKA